MLPRGPLRQSGRSQSLFFLPPTTSVVVVTEDFSLSQNNSFFHPKPSPGKGLQTALCKVAPPLTSLQDPSLPPELPDVSSMHTRSVPGGPLVSGLEATVAVALR